MMRGRTCAVNGSKARGSRAKAGHDCTIGVADLLEFFFGRFVAAIGVRVMALHQGLVAGFDDVRVDRRTEIEDDQGLFLLGPGVSPAGPRRRTIEKPGTVTYPVRIEAIGAAVAAQRPGRPLPLTLPPGRPAGSSVRSWRATWRSSGWSRATSRRAPCRGAGAGSSSDNPQWRRSAVAKGVNWRAGADYRCRGGITGKFFPGNTDERYTSPVSEEKGHV